MVIISHQSSGFAYNMLVEHALQCAQTKLIVRRSIGIACDQNPLPKRFIQAQYRLVFVDQLVVQMHESRKKSKIKLCCLHTYMFCLNLAVMHRAWNRNPYNVCFLGDSYIRSASIFASHSSRLSPLYHGRDQQKEPQNRCLEL